MESNAHVSPLVKASSTGDIDDHEAMSLFGGPPPPTPPPLPVKSVSTGEIDDHESYDLFGVGPRIPMATAVTKGTIPMASTAPVEEGGAGEVPVQPAEPISPANYDLFPALASADKPDKAEESELFPPSRGLSHSDSSSTATDSMGRGASFRGELPRANSNALQVVPADHQTTAPSYKMAGNAVDIVAVKNMDGKYLTTSWHVSFSWSRFRTSYATGVGDMVRILVNGREMPTKMELLERGRCTFITGGLIIPPEDLCFADLTEERPNLVRFEHYQKYTNTVRYVDAKLHLWGPNESVVVVDLDGTLTISDVEGHIRTLRLGQYDFLHAGASDFFTKLHELGMRIVYLTARPLDWASASRTHLENAVQQSISLPPGVLITNSTGLTGALFTEVVNKTPHLFKIQVLNELQLTLIHAGRVIEHPVFVAGFGNRPTDIVAYEEVGMDPSLIFMLDPYSNVKAVSDPRLYESYSDPNALLWLLPRLKHRVPIEKVGRIDDYTVRELVLAEDREQLRMAELEARRLQQEEFERARQEADQARYASSSALRASSRSLSSARRHSTRSATYQQRQFELLVPALQTFQRLHGHGAVPLRFTVPSTRNAEAQQWPEELQGMKLGTTISRFLKACASAKKPSRRRSLDQVRAQLQELGVPEVEDWKRYLWDEVTVPAMETYRSKHGDLLMPVSFTVPEGDDEWPRSSWGYKLGYWTSELRRRKDTLQQYQLEDLETLDFSWNAREARWNRYFVPARQRYQELHGTAQVPQSFVVPCDDPDWPSELGGYRLGQKVNNLRCGNAEEIQEIELIYKNWMLLETLHGVEERDDLDTEDNER
ncbi:LNS2/PITP protein [Phytophthora cactorum]|nr:LNS2/PITP protein [Phytophthora cactorum]